MSLSRRDEAGKQISVLNFDAEAAMPRRQSRNNFVTFNSRKQYINAYNAASGQTRKR